MEPSQAAACQEEIRRKYGGDWDSLGGSAHDVMRHLVGKHLTPLICFTDDDACYKLFENDVSLSAGSNTQREHACSNAQQVSLDHSMSDVFDKEDVKSQGLGSAGSDAVARRADIALTMKEDLLSNLANEVGSNTAIECGMFLKTRPRGQGGRKIPAARERDACTKGILIGTIDPSTPIGFILKIEAQRFAKDPKYAAEVGTCILVPPSIPILGSQEPIWVDVCRGKAKFVEVQTSRPEILDYLRRNRMLEIMLKHMALLW